MSSPNPLPVEGQATRSEDTTPMRVILVGIGGATCSGKTTLAKHLRGLLPNSFIIHQDDFAPPEATLPIHPVMNVQDWDSAPTAIDWPRMRAFLRTVKRTAHIPADHHSHDHLNEQKEVPVEGSVAARWRAELAGLQSAAEAAEGVRIVWGLVDGFLLYWDPEVVETLDARFFMRVPFEVLKQRREERAGYATAEGTFWRDPPGYFEGLVWPAYVDAHKDMFKDGDYERGQPSLERLVLIEPLGMSMSQVVERCCDELKSLVAAPAEASS
ncbi:P-loop containing nucleoside triphosphate hydrolase protein [Auriscalpium vulgare]|uniref:P-loop containing nucleoside triphosphate hydrolase protein n=1 Tax=Auriscalpium vulgare TaxID=40419 RepID=A0ACB8S0T2_9AGAM|nr:P-loop containing nucleoside triphosphate hydrolase protein [Auriscalpium vulgare]